MSRIFEALQRSESERSGSTLQQTIVLPTDLLQAAETNSAGFPEFPEQSICLAQDSRVISLTSRESLAAEKFRFLGVRLRQLQQTRPLKRVLITSTIAEEGKSMVSANLAVTLARKKQQKILLLEGDLRRPVLAQRFGLGKLAGVCEWLKTDKPAISNIYQLQGAGFWFMPAGRPPENPLELMQSGRLAELMDHLSTWFDWIVIDSPPVLPLADTSVWTRVADGVLLVAREGKTEKKELQRGLNALEPSKLLGLVVNSCSNTDHSNYYQRYGAHASYTPTGTSSPEQKES